MWKSITAAFDMTLVVIVKICMIRQSIMQCECLPLMATTAKKFILESFAGLEGIQWLKNAFTAGSFSTMIINQLKVSFSLLLWGELCLLYYNSCSLMENFRPFLLSANSSSVPLCSDLIAPGQESITSFGWWCWEMPIWEINWKRLEQHPFTSTLTVSVPHS